MVSYSKKILTFFVLLQLAVAYGASGQQTGGTYDILQEPRSNLIPYHSRAAALENIPDSSSWVLREYEPWEHEEAEDHSLWTTRYKIPRQWGGRSVIFRVEGVPSPFMLEVNNETAGYAQSGIGRTEFDITSMLKDDYNTIAVRIYKNAATNKIEDHRQHNDLRFRDAFMLAQPRIRVRDITASTLVEPDGRGILSMGVIMASAMRNPYEYTVHYELIDREGKVASSGSREFTTSWFSEDTLRFATTLPGVKPWNHETPNLYTLVVRSFHEGRNVEFVTAKIGFRNISYSNGSVLLNGRQVKLAPSEAAYLSNERRSESELRKLQKSGINCVIVKGNPQPDYFYSICDRIGMYVCDMTDIDTSKQPREITVGGNPSNDPDWAAAYVERAMDMYYSSRLHPSVVMFSPAGNAGNGYPLYESYLALKGVEKDRPIVYLDAGGQWNNDPVSFVDTASPGRVSAAIHKKGSGNVAINVRNSYDLTTAEGYVVYTINQGNKARAVYHEPIAVAPGKSAEVEVPSDRLGLVPKNASVEVFVYTKNHAPGYNATSEPTKGPDPSKIKNGGTLPDLSDMGIADTASLQLD